MLAAWETKEYTTQRRRGVGGPLQDISLRHVTESYWLLRVFRAGSALIPENVVADIVILTDDYKDALRRADDQLKAWGYLTRASTV